MLGESEGKLSHASFGRHFEMRIAGFSSLDEKG